MTQISRKLSLTDFLWLIQQELSLKNTVLPSSWRRNVGLKNIGEQIYVFFSLQTLFLLRSWLRSILLNMWRVSIFYIVACSPPLARPPFRFGYIFGKGGRVKGGWRPIVRWGLPKINTASRENILKQNLLYFLRKIFISYMLLGPRSWPRKTT